MDVAPLGQVTPLSRVFGADRGRPIDRHYIENFLAAYATDIRGRVLEFGDASYTRRFGGARVQTSDVMFPSSGNPSATIVGDLQDPLALTPEAYDCIICTQVLMYIYDVRAPLRTLHRALARGGVVLATFPGISQLSRADVERFGEFWRFTSMSARRLFTETFGSEVTVAAHGNVLAATAFLHGLTVDELTADELDHVDPDHEVTITVRARA